MSLFLKACGAALLAVILILTLGKGREMGLLLSMGTCCLVALAALQYLRPVLDFLMSLESIGNLDGAMVKTILKIGGIGLISEISCLVCNDCGNASLGKTVQLLGSAAILWLSLPLFTALMELIQKILGDI